MSFAKKQMTIIEKMIHTTGDADPEASFSQNDAGTSMTTSPSITKMPLLRQDV
jgi:precorrin isomerase